MCEHYIARAAEPFRLDELWPFTERLERFGIAGFGWGVSWLAADGRLRGYRDCGPSATTLARPSSAAVETTAVLVHLRRPSKLSTLTMADTQPFADPGRPLCLQPQRRPGRLPGAPRDVSSRRAGSMAGPTPRSARAGWRTPGATTSPSPHLLGALHDRFGGQANLAVLTADGDAHHYAGNSENPVFAFRLGRIGVVSTGIYSLDRSLFRYVAPGATDRRLCAAAHDGAAWTVTESRRPRRRM